MKPSNIISYVLICYRKQSQIIVCICLLRTQNSIHKQVFPNGHKRWSLFFHCFYLICCCYSDAKLCPTLCNPMGFNTPCFSVFHCLPELLKLMSIELVMSSNHLILYLPSPLALNLSQHQGLFSESAPCVKWPKYWSSSFSVSPSNECSVLISFRIDWFDLLAFQETLKSLLLHHNSKASVFLCCLLYGPTLTSVHDCQKNHSFVYMDIICWASVEMLQKRRREEKE